MGDIDRIEKTVSEHVQTISVLVGTISRIESFMKESVEFQRKLEITIERLANYESNTKGSFDRVHSRVEKQEDAIQKLSDKLDREIEELKKEHNKKCDAIMPKAHNGNMAYSILVWGGTIIGGVMLLALMARTFGIKG